MFDDIVSTQIFPIMLEYTFVAVSYPKGTSQYLFFKSPSIVFGTPITETSDPFDAKNSPITAAPVLLPSPPITIRP